MPPKERDRLLANVLADKGYGARNHALLTQMYGTGIRLVEAAKILTKDLVGRDGQVKKRDDDDLLSADITFNGIPRPYPIQDETVIDAMQKWVDWRLANGWGVINGALDMEAEFYLKNATDGFKLKRRIVDKQVMHSAEGMRKLVNQLHKINGIDGNVETPLKTWTLNLYEKHHSINGIWILRGDKSIETVRRLCKNHPQKLAKMVEKII